MVLETITEAEDKERMYELNRFHLESELALKTLQLTGVEGDVRSHVGVLTQRLDEIMSEKTAVEDSLRKEKQIAGDLSREQARKGSELAQAQRCGVCRPWTSDCGSEFCDLPCLFCFYLLFTLRDIYHLSWLWFCLYYCVILASLSLPLNHSSLPSDPTP